MMCDAQQSSEAVGFEPEFRSRVRSADFQVCCIAGFQTRRRWTFLCARAVARPADLEVGDTAGWETCATGGQRANFGIPGLIRAAGVGWFANPHLAFGQREFCALNT